MKIFNLKTTIGITLFIFLLHGCASVETTTITSEQNHTAIQVEAQDTQWEQNSTNITTTVESNNSIKTEETPLEQNSTTPIQAVDRTQFEQPSTTPPIVEEVAEEEERVDYTKKFINEDNCNQIIDKEFLVICYDYNLKVAKSVSYTLYGDLVNELNIEERPSFYVEREIDIEYRATTADYTHTGYDRGHLAPDASFDWSQESLESTYSLANIIPQVPKVNRQLWVKAEDYARAKAVELVELSVVNVVSYSNTPQKIGDNNISVSDGYYKILFNTDAEYEECFYYANDFNATTEDDQLEYHKVDCLIVK